MLKRNYMIVFLLMLVMARVALGGEGGFVSSDQCTRNALSGMEGEYTIVSSRVDRNGELQKFSENYTVKYNPDDSSISYYQNGKIVSEWNYAGGSGAFVYYNEDKSLDLKVSFDFVCKNNEVDNRVELIELWEATDQDRDERVWIFKQSKVINGASIYGSLMIKEKGSDYPYVMVSEIMAVKKQSLK